MNAPEDRPPPTSPPAADPADTFPTPTAHADSAANPGESGLPPQPRELPVVPGFAILAEIGRGGMGVVYGARDATLHRSVAIKVLQERYPAGGEAARRFVEESQITSQLQHPGIPPIHQVGALADGRPFLAMKLIKGDTLDNLLKQRRAPGEDRGRFLAAFEQVCQAVGYAHARAVVHRDLKPANVMVGAFGEVQVMDWGLSKSLRDARPSETATERDELPRTAIGSLRGADSATRTGSVLGTPAFMPPEQAGGEVGKIDARSDVFSLGAVLCVVLTGRPPYAGGSAEAVRLMAIRAELADAFARLDACGAEPELVALCKSCLGANREDRPADANELARAVSAFRAAAEERARQAELDRVRAEGERAKAEVEAREQRKRRSVQLALGASLGLLLAAGGAFAWYLDRQAGEHRLKEERAEGERVAERQRAESERKESEAKLKGEADAERRFQAEQARQGVRANLSVATDLRKLYKFKAADAVLEQAAEAARGGAPELLPAVEQARADLALVVKLDDIRFRKWVPILEPGSTGAYRTKAAPQEYRRAFAEHDLDLEKLSPTDSGERIAASAVKVDLVAAVDDWALYEPDPVLHGRLLEVARTADPGSWTDRLRNPSVRRNPNAVAKLAAEADAAAPAPAALSVLADLMKRNGLNPTPMLASARVRHPTDFELAFSLGRNSTDDRSIAAYEAARALRPDNFSVWNNLGLALHASGDLDGATATFGRALELKPKSIQTNFNLGVALWAKGDKDGAIAAYRRVIALRPTFFLAHNNLGFALYSKGDLDGAIAAYREAIRLDRKYVLAHNNLGFALKAKGDLDGAIAEHKEAIRLDPRFAKSHYNLGLALKARGDIPGARAALTEAARLNKRWASELAKLPPVAAAPPPRAVGP